MAWRRVSVIGVTVGLTLAACADGVGPSDAATSAGARPTTAATAAPTPTPATATTSDVEDDRSSPLDHLRGDAQAVPPDGGSLVECSTIPEIKAVTPGNIGPNERFDGPDERRLTEYLDQHAAIVGGRFLDPAMGTIVVTVTEDVTLHRAAIDAMNLEAVVDVLEVDFASQELWATMQAFMDVTGEDRHAELHLQSLGVDIMRNRLSIGLLDPTPEVVDRLGEFVPSTAACLDIIRTPPRPDGPLELIPDIDDDTLVTCRPLPAARYADVLDRQPLAEVAHPSADALREALIDPTRDGLPQGDWTLWVITDDEAHYAVLGGEEESFAQLERVGDNWRLRSWGTGGVWCDPMTVALPDGLGEVEIFLDPDIPPDPETDRATVLVREVDCANGREMGEDLLGPQVIETAEAVLIAFAVIPVVGGADCPSNPSTRVTIQLDEPLGDRELLNGLAVPPRPLVADPDR